MQHLIVIRRPRANLLMGKLLLLHQTQRGFAKKIPHNGLYREFSLQNNNKPPVDQIRGFPETSATLAYNIALQKRIYAF